MPFSEGRGMTPLAFGMTLWFPSPSFLCAWGCLGAEEGTEAWAPQACESLPWGGGHSRLCVVLFSSPRPSPQQSHPSQSSSWGGWAA